MVDSAEPVGCSMMISGSSGKCRGRFMDEVQSELEVGHIPEAVGLSFENFDFVVRSGFITY